jgi:hypothetical protein
MYDQNVQIFDVARIERDARALQAQLVADFFRSLRSSIAARLHRGGAAQTA